MGRSEHLPYTIWPLTSQGMIYHGKRMVCREEAVAVIHSLIDAYMDTSETMIDGYNLQGESMDIDVDAMMEGREKDKKRGWVYLLQDGSRYKIGRTIDIDRRMEEFLNINRNIKLIAKGFGNDYGALERRLHAEYADKNIEREWFSLSPDDVADIIDFLQDNDIRCLDEIT